MTHIGPYLTAAAALIAAAMLALAARWYDRPERRLRRGLRIVLGAEGVATLLAAGHGRGVGLDPAANRLAVVWDAGAWGLVYDLSELRHAEVRVDDQLLGQAWRGRSQNLFDFAEPARRSVTLRLTFEDPAHPDFALDLWRSEGARGRSQLSAREAMAQAAHWLGRMEALLNRPSRSWWEPETEAVESAPLADGVGFEPTVGVNPRRFSRPLP